MGRPRTKPRRYFRAIDTFAFVDDETGTPYTFHKGDLLPEGKLLDKCRMYFEPAHDDDPDVIERVNPTPPTVRHEE